MGYSLMAGLPAVNGLYVAFFSALMYFFFGTARHMSIGTYGIVALMLDSYIVRLEGTMYPAVIHRKTTNGSFSIDDISIVSPSARIIQTDQKFYNFFPSLKATEPQTYLSNNVDEAKTLIAMSFAFYTGIFQVFYSEITTKHIQISLTLYSLIKIIIIN